MDAPETNRTSPVVLKRQAAWDGIRLEHYRFRTGDLPEHRHREHLIVLALSDSRDGEIRTASGFNVACQGRGSVCVIPSGRPMTARLGGASEHLAIYLEPALLLKAAAEARAASSVEVIEKCSPVDPITNSVGLALLSELEAAAPAGRLYAESLANILAVHLLRHYTAAGGSAPRFAGGLSGQRLRRVLAFIADNYERDLSLAELAGAAGMSIFHFAREFKRATGTTPHQHLIKLRIERAKALLADSEMPLIEVGLQSGFSHQSHFSRLFRRLTGTTPQAYRLTFQS